MTEEQTRAVELHEIADVIEVFTMSTRAGGMVLRALTERLRELANASRGVDVDVEPVAHEAAKPKKPSGKKRGRPPKDAAGNPDGGLPGQVALVPPPVVLDVPGRSIDDIEREARADKYAGGTVGAK